MSGGDAATMTDVDPMAASQPGPVAASSNQGPAASGADHNGAVTEDEAALYDRQIRLWGLEAQNRLRTAHVLVLGWNGIATEIIKNTVLSGVGSITLLDPSPVDATVDLLTGFFFRESDVGQPRCSEPPLDRVRALNPLVKVNGIADQDTYDTIISGGAAAEAWLKEHSIDVLVIGAPLVQSSSKGLLDQLVEINKLTRRVGIKFFVSATYGLGGFYFADQLEHDYIVERSVPGSSTGEKKRVKQRQSFVSLADSLAHNWTQLTERQKRRTRIPLDWFAWLAITDLRSRTTDGTSTTSISPSALRDRTVALIQEKGLDPEAILATEGAEQMFSAMASMRSDSDGITLAPVAAVLGGVLSQDILNAISAREEPVVNWLLLNFNASGTATVHKIGALTNPIVVD